MKFSTAHSTFMRSTFFMIRDLGGNALREVNSKLLPTVLSRLDEHPLQSVPIALYCLFFDHLAKVTHII
jgi:hypothetical protein